LSKPKIMDQQPRKVDSNSLKSEDAILICTVCLTVAEALQEIGHYTTIVGGLVPSLLINQESAEAGFHAHAGTRDLDVGIDIGIEDKAKLRTIGDRLRQGGFIPNPKSDSAEAATTWCHGESANIRIDLLVQATADFPHRKSARISDELSATAFDGLEFAFRDRIPLQLTGRTLQGESVTSRVYCCGPASYVILKTQAFLSRGEDKDVYDLVYLLRFWPAGIREIAENLLRWRENETVEAVINRLRGLFADLDSPGPESYTRFRQLYSRYNTGAEADYIYGVEAHSTILQLLRHL
jgi:hypothetical protein